MAEEQKKQDRKKEDDHLNINRPDDWKAAQAAWAKEKLEVAHAHADRFFTTDEELPLSQHILLATITIFFIVFVIWANLATLDEVTRGDGRVIPSSEVQVIQHQEGGIVEAFLVKEGDSVEAGEVLIRLSDVGATSELGSNQKRYLGLKAKSQRLQAEAEGFETPAFSDDVKQGAPESVSEELKTFNANRENYASQLSILQQQYNQRAQEVKELTTRITDLRKVIKLQTEERDTIAPLVERGSAPKLELLQLERGLQERETELNGLLTSLPRAESAVQEAQSRIEELKNSTQAKAQEELSSTLIEMNAIRETLTALRDRQRRTELRSPVDGTIKDIKIATVGGVIQPGAAIMEIVPRDDQLLIEARIRPSDIAFLYPGQKAIVKITAYDYSIYGGLEGKLVDISADSIVTEEGESFYRVRIRTDKTSLQRKGEILPIIPGMVASVDILTGEKTVMEYLLKPFIKTLDEAMNER